MSKICSIYQIHGIPKKKAARILYVKNIDLSDKDTKLKDMEIMQYEISKNIYGCTYICNLTTNYLTKSKKLPMLYTAVVWKNKLSVKHIYTITLYFTITSEVKSAKSLLKEKLKGFFTLELDMEGEIMTLDKEINNFPGNREIEKIMIDLTKEEAMKALHEDFVKDEMESRKEKYGEEFRRYVNPPKATVSLKDLKEFE